MTTLTAQLNGPLSSVPISQSLAIIKPLIDADKNVVPVKTMPNITNVTSLVNTTVAKNQSPLLNFTFTSSDLCLNSAAFTSQPTSSSFGTITVAREVKSEPLQVPALQKPIIVTVSGLPAISQGSRQQFSVISNIASKILTTPIQTMALSDKFHQVTNVPAGDQKTIFPQNFASLPNTNVTVLPKPSISSTLVPPPPTLSSVIPPASFSSTPISYSSITPTVLPSSTGMTSTVAFSVPMTSVQVSQSCSTISVLPIINASNLHKNDKILSVLPPSLTPIKSSKTVAADSSEVTSNSSSKLSQLESQDVSNNKLLPDPLSDDFDPIEAMEWKNGIAHLPGSDLKFRLGEFGTLEVITDDCFEKTENCDAQTPSTKKNLNKQEKKIAIKSEKSNDSLEVKPSQHSGTTDDKICCCENCGCHGLTSEFKSSGRFCSESCLSEYGKKPNVPKKPPSIAPKKLKRQTSLLNNAENAAEVQKKLIRSVGFSWSTYLEKEKTVRAPAKLFQEHQTFPTSRHNFRVGMKLEGIDPRHPSMFCVLTVAEVCGFRMRLHFDGYSDCYDFWINADSADIFPAEWCEQTGHKLSLPKGYAAGEFNWTNYLKMSKAQAAPRNIFFNNPSKVVEPHGFKIGMKLEAVDKKNGFLVCVATIADALDNRFLVHFDGWDDDYDFWAVPSSPFIHPVNWCSENGHVLTPPNNYKESSSFSWKNYLSETNSQPVPTSAFKKRPPHGFKTGMKLEAVDKRNTMLVRVATIADTQPHLIKLHFDGWSDAYDYWVEDDSPDIHPVNWCYRSGHPLQPPINSNNINPQGQGGCPTPGCRGVGHIKGPKFISHHSAFGCPYSQLNMNKDTALQDRLGPPRSEKLLEIGPLHRYTETGGATDALRKCPTTGCDGTGHITGRYSVHHRVADCPLAQSQIELVNGDDSHDSDVSKQVKAPLGRGRKRKLLIEDKTKPNTVESPKLEQPTLQDSIHNSVFSTPPIPDPQLEKSLCWEQHSKFLSGTKQIMSNVLKWSAEQVANYISRLSGCEEYSKLFSDEQIDGEAFLLLNQTDIVNILNIKLGPALKIYNSILSFKKSIGD